METYKGYGIEIEQDECPESPREWDNLGVLMLAHKRYDLPCEVSVPFDGFESWREAEEWIVNEYHPVWIAPVYGYDHSSFTVALHPHGQHYNFDGGRVGFVMVRQEDIDKMGTSNNPNESLNDVLARMITNELNDYNAYLNGNVVGFRVLDPDGEQIDSCWGYYEYKACMDDAKRSIDEEIKHKESKAWEHVYTQPEY